jgi:hypothetical protein
VDNIKIVRFEVSTAVTMMIIIFWEMIIINIKIDLRELGWYGIDWIHLAQNRDQWRAHVNAVVNLRVP